jgi:UDP-glucose 4-epimerase
MKLELEQLSSRTEDVHFGRYQEVLEFRVGDVRDIQSLCKVVRGVHAVIHAAALKQVPSCEYFPTEAIATNVKGAENVVQAIKDYGDEVEVAAAISTDKACKPVNVMGMTKALQERIFTEANIGQSRTRFVCVRYGNVVGSRGSVIPYFNEQIRMGGPLTITVPEMTRFLISLDGAVDAVMSAIRSALPGEILVPRLPSVRLDRLAKAMIGTKQIETKIIGIRPGEKIHEIMISEDEAHRSVIRGKYYAIGCMLPEVGGALPASPAFTGEFSSADCVADQQQTYEILNSAGVMLSQ